MSGTGLVDKELSAKLASEIKIETEMRESDDAPPAIQEFLSAGPFSIRDIAGHDEVEISRTFGNESISIVFSVSDMDNADENEDLGIDEGTESSGSARGTGDKKGEEGGEEAPGFPVRCLVTIAKEGSKTALHIDTVTQDGMFIIDNIAMCPTELTSTSTAEIDWKVSTFTQR